MNPARNAPAWATTARTTSATARSAAGRRVLLSARCAKPPSGGASYGARRHLTERVHLRVPERPGEAKALEDRAHLVGLRAARVDAQARGVPRGGEAPELRDRDERAHRRVLGATPRGDVLFRPEEEHSASGEDDVVPPPCRGNGAVEEPGARLRPLARHLEQERLHRVLAPRAHQRGLAKRRRDAQRVPGAVGVVAEDRKSTRLNSSHLGISYAVFCLKKKK